MTRIERFRQYVAAMDPTSPFTRENEREFYVDSEPRRTLVDAICTPLELAPQRRVLLLGCTGSGKTTLVRRCVERIRNAITPVRDFAKYVDVSEVHRLDAEGLSGVLVAIAGEELARQKGSTHVGAEYLDAKEAVERHARGYNQWVDRDDLEEYQQPDDSEDEAPGYLHHTRGVIQPPRDPLQPKRFSELVAPLTTLQRAAVGPDGHAIFAFDSLDRLSTPALFSNAVKHDLPVLAAAGIGTIVVGPVRYALGSDRSVRDLFDAVEIVPTIDTASAEGSGFLARVIRARDVDGVLADAVLPRLVAGSGGILRDLLSLARRTGERAYSRGHETATADDVDAAISALGDSLAFGIDDANLRVLRALDEKGTFVIRGESELSLVDQGRVLNVGPGAWAIHPALLPKLRAIPKEAA